MRFLAGLLVLILASSAMAQDKLRPGKGEQLSEDLIRYVYNRGGQTTTIFVPIRPGDSSFLLTALAADSRSEVRVLNVQTPSGAVPYRLDRNARGRAAVVSPITTFPIAEEREVSMIYPLHPGAPLTPGTYAVTVETTGRAGIKGATAVVKGALRARQAIDFNIWVALDNPALKTQTFQQRFGGAIRRQMNRLLVPYRMQVGQLRFYNATAEEARTLDTPSIEDVRTVCRGMQRRVGLSRAMNLIWVNRITYRNIAAYGGIASGQPGSMFLGESDMTCVMASFNTYGNDLDQHAVNFLHEAAHFMGLPHTTESDGRTFDRFSDTPTCPIARHDGSYNSAFGVLGKRDGSVDDYECGRRGGADNFLFYGGVSSMRPFKITPQQAWVMQRHPLFYPIN